MARPRKAQVGQLSRKGGGWKVYPLMHTLDLDNSKKIRAAEEKFKEGNGEEFGG